MKKIYFLAMMAMLAMSTTSCTVSISSSRSTTTVVPSVDINKVAQGTWKATLQDGTVCTLKVTGDKGFMDSDLKSTLTIGGNSYEGIFKTSFCSFTSQDRTASLNNGKFGENYKTFSATVKANNESLGTATFSKQ